HARMHALGDETDAVRLARRNGRAGEDDGERFAEPDQTRQPRRAAEPRNNAELHFREADPRLGPVARDAGVAGEDHLGAATETDSIDGGHAGNRQQVEATEYRLTECGRGLRFGRVRDRGDLRYVCAGNEPAILAAAKDDRADPAGPRDGLELAAQRVQPRHHVARQQIDTRIRTVENEPGDAIARDLERQRRLVFRFSVHSTAAGRLQLWPDLRILPRQLELNVITTHLEIGRAHV